MGFYICLLIYLLRLFLFFGIFCFVVIFFFRVVWIILWVIFVLIFCMILILGNNGVVLFFRVGFSFVIFFIVVISILFVISWVWYRIDLRLMFGNMILLLYLVILILIFCLFWFYGFLIGLNGFLVVIRVFLFVYFSKLVGIVLCRCVGFDNGRMMGCLICEVILCMIFFVNVLGIVDVLISVFGLIFLIMVNRFLFFLFYLFLDFVKGFWVFDSDFILVVSSFCLLISLVVLVFFLL